MRWHIYHHFTTFFRLAREGIEEQAAHKEGMSLEEVKKEMGYTDERGAQTPETCAIVQDFSNFDISPFKPLIIFPDY